MILLDTTLSSGTSLLVREACTEADYDHARRLMRGFVDWCRERYGAKPGYSDAYFKAGNFDEELKTLDQIYAAPGGTVLLVLLDEEPVGTVAFKTIGPGISEMKRFFLLPEKQGVGAGRALAVALMELAQARGFSSMRLETAGLQYEAIGLYKSLGFKDIEVYSDVTPAMAKELIAMEIDL